MIDPKLLRSEPEKARKGLSDRGGRCLPSLNKYLELEKTHRSLLRDVERMRAKRNESSKAIGKAMAAKHADEAQQLKSEVSALKAEMQAKEAGLAAMKAELRELLLGIPNIPHLDVPLGRSEADNRPVRDSGAPPRPEPKPLAHVALGEKLGILDFPAGAKLSGSRFAVLRAAGARLHRAIGQFMIDHQTRENGYCETWVPLIVRPEVLEGTGQLPKFEADLYRTGQLDESEKGPGKTHASYMIPTAEVPLTNLVRGDILEGRELPKRYAAWTPCFRQEAGSYGKDVYGFIRQHQFEKVELVWITRPDESMKALEELTAHAESVLKALGLPYRVVELCTADLGFGALKTYDLEVWLPGEGRYREISSCSNCGDFQARRMNARFRPAPGAPPQFVHTLNGSGLAVGRTFIAVLENGQRPDGSIEIPEPLRPYFGSDCIPPQRYQA